MQFPINSPEDETTFVPDDSGAVEVLPAEHDELFERSLRAASAAVSSPPANNAGIWLLVSLVVFVISNLGGFNFTNIGLLIGVLVFHEAGHYLGMKMFSYRNVKMFFIPFFGAAVSGKKHAAAAWQEVIVVLLWPLPGLVLATVLYAAIRPTDSSGLPYQAIVMLLVLNGFNLLPFLPLDGGRVMNVLVFRRHPVLEVVFKLFAIVGLGLLALALRSFVLGGIAGMILLRIGYEYKLAARARKLRLEMPDVKGEWNQLGLGEFQRLYREARELVPVDGTPGASAAA